MSKIIGQAHLKVTRSYSDKIITSRPDHLLSEVADLEIREAYGQHEISDACALTIAAWWQSPGTVGAAMAELASTGEVDLSALLEDISATRRLNRFAVPNHESLALDMLATWAINHESLKA